MARNALPAISLPLLLAIALLAVATGAEAKGKAVVNSSAVVKEWCEKKSFIYFKKKKLTPYNWSASWWDEGNAIVVKGEWRVDQKMASVTCSAERGQGVSGAVMEVKYEE